MALVPTRSTTASTWASSAAILTKGEVGIESDTGVVKVGDGILTWAHLPVYDNQTTSAVESSRISDETGTGAIVLATSPTITTATLTTPTIATPIVTGGTFSSPAITTPVFTVANAIAASATQTQVAATAMTKDINRVTTVATAGDAVKLPAATAGAKITVINANVTNACGVFPASGDAINAIAADGVYSLAATKVAQFYCAVAGTWNVLLGA